MTKLGREFWQDAFNSGYGQGTEQGKEHERQRIAEQLLRKGADPDMICECTGLTPEEVRELQDRISITT